MKHKHHEFLQVLLPILRALSNHVVYLLFITVEHNLKCLSNEDKEEANQLVSDMLYGSRDSSHVSTPAEVEEKEENDLTKAWRQIPIILILSTDSQQKY